MRALTIMATALLAGPVLAQGAMPGPPSKPAAPVSSAPVKTTLRQPVLDPGDGTQPRQRFVTVFGVDTCPPPSSPDEIVVCTRLPDAEQYRVPTQLRRANDKRVSAYEYNRNLLLGDGSGGAGSGIGSCSVNGPGGYIGCNRKQVDAWAADRAARMGTDEATPKQ